MSGFRTNPTVKSVSSMNKKNLERWEMRLGVAQVVIVLGVVTGCMTFAFYLGFFAGKSAGFEFAMETNATSAAKLPISGDGARDKSAIDITEQAVSDVYARLNEKAKKEASEDSEILDDVPSLGSIKEMEHAAPENAAPAAPAVKDLPGIESEAHKVWDADETQKEPASDVKVLGDDLPKSETTTAKVNPAAGNVFGEDEHPIDRALDEAGAPKKAVKDDKPTDAIVEKEVKKEAPKPTATPVPPTPTPKKVEAKKEEPKKEVKKEEGASIIRGAIPKGWFAQVAAPTKLKDAEGVASQLKKNGFRVVIETAKVRGDEYYRILVGPEGNKQQAELLVQQLKRESYLSGSPFIRMVK